MNPFPSYTGRVQLFVGPKPNATVMQEYNDNRKTLDRTFRFPSKHIGSPCQSTPEEESSMKSNINHKCGEVTYPMSKAEDNDIPDECWPRLVIITSYPTSGSFMSRLLFSLNTGLATGQKGQQMRILDWGGWSKLDLDAQSHCESNLQLPYAGRVALVKTHRRPERHNIFIENGVLQQQPDYHLPSHIVRLVRNPGDNMLREASRMYSESKTNLDQEAFEKQAKQVCDEVFNKQVSKYLYYHRKWEEVSKYIPSIMLHYEVMTDPDIVGERMREIVDFVGETTVFDVDYAEVVKRPKYVQGALFKEMCGIDMARKLHGLTKEVDDSIGYTFDWEEGVWNLRDAAPSPHTERHDTKNTASLNSVEPHTLQEPNATAMQIHNDIRKIEIDDVDAYKMQSNILGSPCQQEMVPNELSLQNSASESEVGDKCSKRRFPFSKTDVGMEGPDECWPSLVIVPSYPTSGSFMARMLFSLNTGLATGTLGMGGTKGMVFNWGGGNVFKVQGAFCDSNLQLPYAGRVALLKTHRLPGRHNIIVKNGVLRNETEYQLPSHIVRLVRNPGDHMLREASRMYSESQTNLDQEEFEKHAKQVCEEVIVNQVPKFLSFHKQWEEASQHIPSIMFPYEEMTDPDVVGERMREIVDFVGETRYFEVNYTEIVRRPKYVHGTLFKEMCGVEMARQLYEHTKDVADLIGYTFDWQEGVWSLMNPDDQYLYYIFTYTFNALLSVKFLRTCT